MSKQRMCTCKSGGTGANGEMAASSVTLPHIGPHVAMKLMCVVGLVKQLYRMLLEYISVKFSGKRDVSN